MDYQTAKSMENNGEIKSVSDPVSQPNTSQPNAPEQLFSLDDYVSILEDIRTGKLGFERVVEQGTFDDDFDITAIAKDPNGIYRLFIEARHSVAFSITYRLNGDSGTNYTNVRHYTSYQSGTFNHDKERVTGDSSIIPTFITQKNYLIETTFATTPGGNRLFRSHTVGEQTNYQDMVDTFSFWTNTTDQIKKLTILSSQTLTEGRYKLIKIA